MTLQLIGKLVSPMSYLRIRHEEKRIVDFYLPVILAVLATFAFNLVPSGVAILGRDGLVYHVNGLLQVLTGFYVAALAAVSTFHSATMDFPMSGSPPMIREKRKGKRKDIPLTRRRFLCYLFGYLALICFIIFSAGLLSNLITATSDLRPLLGEYYQSTRTIGLFIYLLALFNMMTVTLLGLYYLTVRLHTD